MLRLHERTSRLVCRVGFVALCVIPTCAALLYCVWHALPFQARAMERHLTMQLGLRVDVASAATPRLDRLQLHDLRLTDPETDQPVATVGLLEAGRIGTEYWIWLNDVTVAAGQLQAAHELLDRRLRQRLAHDAPTVRMVVTRLRLETDDAPLEFRQALVQCHATPHGAEARLRLDPLDAADESASWRIELARRHAPAPSVTLDIRCETTPAPCTLVAQLLPSWRQFGAEAMFRGRLTLQQSDRGANGVLRGDFTQINLAAIDALRGSGAGGFGALHIAECSLQEGRLETLRGTLDADRGTLTAAWLAAAAEALQLQADVVQQAPQAAQLQFDRLAVGFTLDAEGLELVGRCPPSADEKLTSGGAPLMVDEWGPLLENRAPGRRSLNQLLAAMSPSRSWQATEQTAWLATRLPTVRLVSHEEEAEGVADRRPLQETSANEERRSTDWR